jgi:hypothetical protein
MNRGEVHTGLEVGGLKERDSLETLVVDVNIVLKWALKK